VQHVTPAESADERVSKAESEHRRVLAEISSLKLQLQAADAAVASAHASCEQKIKKYDSDLVYSGQTAASLRRQLSDAVEEKARAVAVANEVSSQELTYKTTISNLQSSKDVAQRKNAEMQLELQTTKESLSRAVESYDQLNASSSKRIAELVTTLSEADATIRDQSIRISSLQAEFQMKEDSLAAASANITSWSELCASLKRQIEEFRISESSVRENVRLELEDAASKVKIAEDILHKTQNECCAALKAMSQAEALAVAQADSDRIALKAAEAQALKNEDALSAIRSELQNFRSIQSCLEAETAARIALEKKCAEVEESASSSVSTASAEQKALSLECESLKAQLHRAIQSANASASAKDSLKAEVEKLSAQLHHVHQEIAAIHNAAKKECDSLSAQLAQASVREQELVAAKDALTSQLAELSSAVLQERGEAASFRNMSDESKAQIAQMNEHIEELRAHVAKAAHSRLIQDETCAGLTSELDALQRENRELKVSLEAFERNKTSDIGSKARIMRLEDDKRTLQEQVESLMDSARMAIEANCAREAAQDQVEHGRNTAQTYKTQVDEMRIGLDEAMEATASLATQAEHLSLENSALKEQVTVLKDQVMFPIIHYFCPHNFDPDYFVLLGKVCCGE
jgi:chromosome segregation ATPase